MRLQFSDAARVLSITPTTVVQRTGDAAEVECELDGAPLDASMVRWVQRTNSSMSTPVDGLTAVHVHTTSDGRRSVLAIRAMSTELNARYECHVDNRVTATGHSAGTYVLVRSAPRLHRVAQWAKAAGALGASATFRCRATAVPGVEWAWRRGGSDDHARLITNSSRMAIVGEQVDEMTFETTLTIAQLNEADFQQLYSCAAMNTDGQDSAVITLTQTRKCALAITIKTRFK